MAEAAAPPLPWPAHRFVPTLTEVVHPERLVAPAEVPVVAQEFLEEIVEEAIRRAEVSLAQRLPEVLGVILHEQALAMSERLRREIKSAVSESVAAALAEKLPALNVVRRGQAAPEAGQHTDDLDQ